MRAAGSAAKRRAVKMKKLRKLAIYGDSISTGTHGEGGYESYLAQAFGVETANYAVGSSGLSLATPDSGAAILADENNIPADADVVFIWHGSNDWYWGSPVGEVTDQTPDTFLGAIAASVSSVRKKVPDALLVWGTPLYRFEAPDGGTKPGKAYGTKNKLGLTMEAYYEAIYRASVYHGFPVIDLRRLCGIHEKNQDLYLEDKVHPNRAGYEKIRRVLKKGLEELLYYEGYIWTGEGKEEEAGQFGDENKGGKR